MSTDPLSPRNLAAIVAVGGLGAMMTAPEPTWRSAGLGLACLVAFTGLSLVPSRRSAPRRTRATRPLRAMPRAAENLPLAAPEPPLAGQRGLNEAHPALFHGLRTRRGSVSRSGAPN